MVSGAKCTFNGNGKIISFNGLWEFSTLLQRVAHAVPSCERIRLLIQELFVKLRCAFELACTLEAEGQFVDRSFVAWILR